MVLQLVGKSSEIRWATPRRTRNSFASAGVIGDVDGVSAPLRSADNKNPMFTASDANGSGTGCTSSGTSDAKGMRTAVVRIRSRFSMYPRPNG